MSSLAIQPTASSLLATQNATQGVSVTGSHRKVDGRAKLGEFVGNIFYGTLIKQMNESTIKGAFGHGGRAEETFNGQLAQQISQKLGRAKNNPLVNRLQKAIDHRQAAKEKA